METIIVVTAGLALLAVVSGMLGLGVAGAAGSFVGARLTSLFMPSARIKQLSGVLIVIMTLYKI